MTAAALDRLRRLEELVRQAARRLRAQPLGAAFVLVVFDDPPGGDIVVVHASNAARARVAAALRALLARVERDP